MTSCESVKVKKTVRNCAQSICFEKLTLQLLIFAAWSHFSGLPLKSAVGSFWEPAEAENVWIWRGKVENYHCCVPWRVLDKSWFRNVVTLSRLSTIPVLYSTYLYPPSIYLLQHSQQTCTTWSDNVLVFEQWDVQRPEETINLLKPTTWLFYHQKSTPFANTLYTSSQNNHTYLNSHRPKSAEIQRPMKHDRNRIYRRRNSFMHV